ncbi:hypothetical protein H4R27_002432 [Coemansia aciculifera]|nr:hypothetical protein H4R27_002432 [Coemansia aciculifera]
MRLFRKSKTGQGSAGTDASKQLEMNQPPQTEQPEILPSQPPQPPPVLQLDFELPSVPPINRDLNGTTTGAPGGGDICPQQQQQYDVGGAIPGQGFHATMNMGDNAEGGLLHQGLLASDMQRIAAAYNFDYPFQLAEDSSQSQTEEDSVQRQLAEQFGFGPKAHRAIPQPQHSSSQSNVSYSATMPHHTPSVPASHVASNSSPSLSSSQKHQQLARVVMHNMQMATANRTTFSNTPTIHMAMSHSSNGGSSASSEDECGVPKLRSSMTAMSLSGGAPPATSSAAGKLSDRAQHIQKVREASALGKVVAFSKTTYSAGGVAANGDEGDDEDDLVPLGGLRKAANNSVPNISAVDRNGVQASMPAQHATHGHMFPSPVAYDGGAGMAKHFVPQHALSMHNLHQQQQHLYPYSQHQQYQQSMHSPSTASVTSQMSAPMVMRRATIQQPGPGTGQNQHHMYPGSSSQQMAYPRSKAAAGGIGSAYSHVGYSRTPGMPDPSSHAYTPSPLGQVPVYSQPAIAIHQQMPPADMHTTQYPPAMMNHTGMPMANQQLYPQRVQPYQLPQQPLPQQYPPQQFLPPHPQTQQFPPQQFPPPQQLPQLQPQATTQHQHAPVGQHPAALASFIPSQLACRGSMAKNPLMRDINKLKDFSAKDYTTRPTLLAEVDSRQQARKNMPGLGGTTSHSYQPEAPPPIQQQPLPPLPEPQPQQHQSFRPHDQGEYRDHHDQANHYPRPNRYEASYHNRSRSCQIFDDEDNDYSSVSSRTSGHRRHGAGRNGSHGPTRRHRYDHVDNAYGSEYGERLRRREFRQVAPPPSSHDRRVVEQRRQPRRNARYYEYEHHDYEERSETYARDYYDDLDDDEDFDERYGDRYDHRLADPGSARRRDAQRQPCASDVRVGRARGEARWASPYSSRGNTHGRHGYHTRPRLVHLDDPRDGDSVIIRSSPPPIGKASGSDSESLLVLEHGKPRSQFGRILANLKRQTTGFTPMSPKATVHSVQIREAKVIGGQRAADGRIIEVKSENEDEVESMPASALPEANVVVDTGNAAPILPTEPAEQNASEQPLQTVATTETAVDNDNSAEAHPAPPTPVATSVVPVAAT